MGRLSELMPITQYTELPWRVRCDTCDAHMGSEDYGSFILYDTREEAETEIRDWLWRLIDGVVTCESCLEEERIEAESSKASD